MKTFESNTTEYNDSEVLKYLIQSGNINMNDVETAMRQAEQEKIIQEKHPYAITQGKDGRWRTYIKTNDGRKLIAKATLEKLNNTLYEHYKVVDAEATNGSITLKQLYPKWLEYKSLHTDAKTYILRIGRDWKKYYIDTEIIDVPIKDLNKVILDEWAHKLIKDYDMSNKQYYNATVIMRQALNYAVDLDIIVSSPFNAVKIDGRRLFRKVRKKDNSTQVFFKDEVRQIEELAWNDFEMESQTVHKLAPLAVLFQFQTGMRIGELCAIRYEDINETATKIRVQRMYRYETDEIAEHTKGSYGDREVILTDKARELIRAAKIKQNELGVSSSEYIFSVNENPLPYDSLRYLYHKYCKEIGTVYKSSHKSRKTYISSLIDAGVNINTIRESVGHCDERTTFQSYCFDRSTEDEKISQFEAALT